MQKVMRMRVLRELKANCLRYLALGFMILMAMFLVVTIVGSGENLTRGTEELAEETNLEDGEFTLFVPLVKDQIAKIKDMNIDLEEQFYLDCTVGNGSTIRVYKVRKSINKQKIIEGSAPINPQEVTVEKRYAIENGIKPGCVLEIGKKKYKVVGICCVSDYDGPYKAVTDTSCNSKSFGLCFMSDEDYEGLKDAGVGDKTEEYTYAYKLSGDATDDELKEYLKDIRIKSDQVDDKFFKEYWDRTGGMTDNLTSSTEKMKDATDEISEALLKLKRNNGKINEGASEIFDASLMQANNSLAEAKIKTNLTEKNYKSELDRLSADSQNGLVKYSINDAREQLDGLKSFKDGVKKYTDGVKKISKGTEKMYEGVDELDSAVDEAVDEMGVKLSNLTTFLKRSDNPRIFATKHDKEVDIHVGLLAGAILFVLMAYVISVFVVHSIENESSIIGTLYAMGVTKRDLIVHYITLPVVITTLAGIIGAGLAGTGIMVPMIAQSSYDYFSIPHFEFSVQPYLWIYSIVVPPVISALVNIIVINSKLNKTALSLIRREKKQTRIRKVNLGGMNFVTAFRIRQIFREMRSALALIAGMFIALYVFMMALNCFLLCGNIAKDYERDTKYSYMYMVKYPESEAPKSAEQAFAQTFKKETMG
ncbi:MAG: FtsX-like permease family protein, partial [Eubacterium sp.]|nr:FtsX-like permease family protein [Eubacterium sp.]